MKKILAIALALLMAFSALAVAEAPVAEVAEAPLEEIAVAPEPVAEAPAEGSAEAPAAEAAEAPAEGSAEAPAAEAAEAPAEGADAGTAEGADAGTAEGGEAAPAEPEAPMGTGMQTAFYNITMSNGSRTATLDDLNVTMTVDVPDDIPTLLLSADNGSEKLASIVMRLVGNRALFAISGIDHADGQELPNTTEEQAQAFAQALPTLLVLMNTTSLPVIPGIPVPKVDIGAMLAPFATGDDGNGATRFEIPYEAFNNLINMIVTLAQQSSQKVAGLDSVLPLINKLQEKRMGISMKGIINDSETQQEITADIYTVSGDTISTEPLAKLSARSYENNLSLLVTADIGGNTSELASATLASWPDLNRLDFESNLMSGVAGLSLKLYVENGIQKAMLSLNSLGQASEMGFEYGAQDGKDVLRFHTKVPNAAFSISSESALGEDGLRTGTLTIETSNGDSKLRLASDYFTHIGDTIEPDAALMPEDVRSFDQIDAQAINDALYPLKNYLQGAALAPAA